MGIKDYSNSDWDGTARDFLGTLSTYLGTVDESKLRPAMMDIHSWLEGILRSYLLSTTQINPHEIERAGFAKLVITLKEQNVPIYGLEYGTEERLLEFNHIRNDATHRLVIPDYEQVREYALLAGSFVASLLGESYIPEDYNPHDIFLIDDETICRKCGEVGISGNGCRSLHNPHGFALVDDLVICQKCGLKVNSSISTDCDAAAAPHHFEVFGGELRCRWCGVSVIDSYNPCVSQHHYFEYKAIADEVICKHCGTSAPAWDDCYSYDKW